MTDTTTTTTSSGRMRRSGLLCALAIPLALFALAGCSSAGSAPETTPGTEQQLSSQEWTLQYTQCMRDEGVDMADPGPDGSISMSVTDAASQEVMDAANKKCVDKLGPRPAASQEEQDAADQQYLEWGRKLAACYRDHGYDMPDPTMDEEMQFPEDAPQDVQDECGGGAGSVAKRAN